MITNSDSDQHRSCISKKQFLTEADAKIAAKSLNGSPKNTHIVTAYACTFCGLWHIGRKRSKQ